MRTNCAAALVVKRSNLLTTPAACRYGLNATTLTARTDATRNLPFPLPLHIFGSPRSASQRSHPRAYATSATTQTAATGTASADSPAVVGKRKSWNQLSGAEKVKKAAAAAKVTGNFGIVTFGVVVFGTLAVALGTELFSGNSVTNIYSNALEKIRDHPHALRVLGSPIVGHGRASRRRSTRPAYQYTTDAQGQEHMLVMFYVEGSLTTGTAFINLIKDEEGRWIYQSLYVDVPDSERRAHRIVVLPEPTSDKDASKGILHALAGFTKKMFGRDVSESVVKSEASTIPKIKS